MKLTATQKIVIGRILIGVMSLFCLSFLLALAAILFKDEYSAGEKTSYVFTFGFVIGLFCLPLYYGMRLYRQGKHELATRVIIPVEPDTLIKIISKIQPQDYLKLHLILLYSNAVIIFVTFLGVFFILIPLINRNANFFSFQTIFGLFALMLPVAAYFQAKKNYNSNQHLKEEIRYEFDENDIISDGTTFRTVIKWSSLHKVKELKHWFLLYTSTQTMIPIPKASFTTTEDLTNFRRLILSTKVGSTELRTA